MALYFIKPVVWNEQNYLRPSGAKFTAGYPAEHGFGHEEWNNSDRLEFSENGQRLRIFHTEGFGNQPLSKHSGRIFVFMIASHGGEQHLVSIACQATGLFDNEPRRHQLANNLNLKDFWKDVWNLETVKQKYKNKSEFQQFWANDYKWLPTWTCPVDSYLPLKKPLLLTPKNITGKNKFLTMYSSYQEIDGSIALRILDLIPASENVKILANLKSLCGSNSQDASDDIARIEEEISRETTKTTLIDARLGQGKFRAELIRIWNGRCAVTGCSVVEALRASHIKPWRSSTNKERLDPQNGLLLGAHLDALFDAGLISFDDGGLMLVSKQIHQKDRKKLHLGGKLKKAPSPELKVYLEYHRLHVARDVTN